VTNLEGAGTDSVAAPLRVSRADYERRQRLRGSLIAAASTVLVLAVVVIGVPRLDGWKRVRQQFFDGKTFRESFPHVARAFLLDVRIFVVCVPLILVFGMAIALARGARAPVLFPLRVAATLYVDIVRGVPILLWLFLIGFGGAGLINKRSVGAGPFGVGTLLFLGGLALVITYSAYVAEVFRAGIESIHESQRSGARSLGLSTWQTNRHVVLPQAVRRVVPPLMNDFISLQKDVSLISVLGPIEALRRADVIQDRTFNFTSFVVAAVLFLCVSIPLTRTADYLLAKERRATSGTAIR
jgi:polar amino acid transport system permease protein